MRPCASVSRRFWAAFALFSSTTRGDPVQPDGRTIEGLAHVQYAGLRPDDSCWEGGNTLVEADIESTPLDVEAMEILNRFSYDLFLEVRDDWRPAEPGLLDHGHGKLRHPRGRGGARLRSTSSTSRVPRRASP